MEGLKLRYFSLQQALQTLENGLAEIQEIQLKQPKFYTLMRDGTIQRFEYCFDSFWKFLKLYLEIVNSVSIESPSPRPVLRLALDGTLITDDQCLILLDALSKRNLTSHSYNEALADTIQDHIPLYLVTMKAIIERLAVESIGKKT